MAKLESKQVFISPFSIAGMKRNPSVMPVVGCIIFGVSLATAYTIRLAVANPDVTWTPQTKTEPWNDYEKKNYKFIQSEPFDIKNYNHPRPRF